MKFPRYDVPTLSTPDGATRVPPVEAVTLFSGLGSSSKAAQDLGLTVLAHDFLPEAVASLNANGFDAVQGDIRQVDFTAHVYSNVRLVVGGPPCQPFSQGGRNAGENDPRDMIPDFQRCVAQTLPEVFILENVRGLAGPRHRAYLDRRIAEFEAIGYVVEWRVLDCAEYGAPQSRKRLFMIGVRVDIVEERGGYPVAWPSKQPTVTMAEALGWTAVTCDARNEMAPEAARSTDLDRFWPLHRPSTTVVGSFRPEIQAAPGFRKAGDGPRQNAKGSVYTTPEERLVLQQMPRDWVVCGSKTKRDLQIGNSCPNGVLRSLIAPNLSR